MVGRTLDLLQTGNYHWTNGPIPNHSGFGIVKGWRRKPELLSYSKVPAPVADAHSTRAGIHQNGFKTNISVWPPNQHFSCIGLIVARLIASFSLLCGLRVFLLRHVGRSRTALT
jgi:hypothetical protein